MLRSLQRLLIFCHHDIHLVFERKLFFLQIPELEFLIFGKITFGFELFQLIVILLMQMNNLPEIFIFLHQNFF